MTSLQDVNPTVLRIRAVCAGSVTQENPQVLDLGCGDPHRAGTAPITFIRQVLAACSYPELLEGKTFPADVRQRALSLLDDCAGRSVGSYCLTGHGLPRVKKSISDFITRRDGGVRSHPDDIVIASGSLKALTMVLHLLSSGGAQTPTGVLVPAPGPHSLRPLLVTCEVTLVPYQLRGDQDRGWALDLDQLHRALEAARGRCEPRALYVSNPGNPTGHVQDRKSIEDVIRFAAEENLMLLVDEVYQDSVLSEGSPGFLSYKRVLMEMDSEFTHTVQMVSFNSLSNACMGECGLSTGYMELVNFDPRVSQYLISSYAAGSPPVLGQLALDLMVAPPTPGQPSHHNYTQEIRHIRNTLSQNALRACHFLNQLPGVSCQSPAGGVFVYPSVQLPTRLIEEAQMSGVEPDVLFCQKLQEEEGLCLGPGSDNGQEDGNYHIRLCVLAPPPVLDAVLARLQSFHRRLLETFH